MDQNSAPPINSQNTIRPALKTWMPRLAIILLIALGVIVAARVGMQFRHWMWDTTVPIRFTPDIDRGYQWGRLCAVEGYLNQYEKMQSQQPDDEGWLDYAPLRLGVMAMWGKQSLSEFPHVQYWHQDRSFALTAPVLHFNLFMELVGLLSAFLLTRLWVIRSRNLQANLPPNQNESLRYFFRGCAPGLFAALLLWFNPAIVLSAYGWPTWDLWIVPLFLLAAFLASVDWWFTAGLVIGIGAMFKGQQLLAVPVFVVWSLILWQPLDSLKFAGGVVTAIAIVTTPWLFSFIPPDQLAHAREIQIEYGQAWQVPLNVFKLTRRVDIPAIVWVIGILLCAVCLPWVSWVRRNSDSPAKRWQTLLLSPWTWRTIAAIASFTWAIWPWFIRRNHSSWEIGVCVAASLAGLILIIRPRGIAYLGASSTAMAMLLCMSIFHGSSAWYDCGLHYGTIHWPHMTMGMTDNLPGIMVADFNWEANDLTQTAITLPAHLVLKYPAEATEISTRTFLLLLFWITLIPCCAGLGLHARRRSERILIALSAPWLMFFCFCPQIHERYLLFAAGISCVCAGASMGMTLLGVFLSAVTFIMTLHVMLNNAREASRYKLGQNLANQFPWLFKDNAGEKLRSICIGTHPDLGYAVILCGLIFMYFSVARRPASSALK